MKVDRQELENVVQRAVRGFGYTEREATTIAEVLMYAQLRGNNQGVAKLIGPGIPKSPTSQPPRIENETRLSALVNGGNSHAMLVLTYAVGVVLEKVGSQGVGVVGVNGLNTSSGAIGYYAREIAAKGFVGIVLAGASPVVAPAGSYEPVFGTNPIALAVPSTKEPVVLDMATAAMAFFGVIEAKAAGIDLPEGVAFDQAGKPTTDPARALEGALRTFDRGVKSSGLAFMVQALTGPLTGASYAGIGDVAGNWGGHLLIALDPGLLGGAQALREGVTAMVDRVKSAKRLEGVGEILVPGERGDRLSQSAQGSQVEIEDNLYREVVAVAERHLDRRQT